MAMAIMTVMVSETHLLDSLWIDATRHLSPRRAPSRAAFRVLPMNKKAWAMKFKKHAVLAGVNEPKKSCHGVRKARAEVAAYADCTESQMMAMFGWTDPKMPAHYIAQANREKLGISGMEKIVAFDQSQSLDDFLQLPEANSTRTSAGNGVVTFPGNIRKKA